ncbi:MAG TPA: DUF6687 family protein [Candidatus Polarisedimenticolia bacterium]|nr:DUF6687 family protein [Candidatus Polarisedimenticolia bacterium]
MLFTYYDERLASLPFLCVDGVVPTGLNLSHWPGNRTPPHLKADTSTEMALKLARDPGRAAWLRGVSIVTNNHFDTDGLLSVYAVLHPEQALGHAEALVQAARTGDFGEFNTAEAFKFDAIVSAFDDDAISPIAGRIRDRPEHERYQIIYDHLLELLPDLLAATGRYQPLWSKPLAELMRSLLSVRSMARVREHDAARLTVIEADRPIDRMARFNIARHHRVLTAERSPHGWIYEMAFQVHSWFDTVTPPRGGRIDLADMAAAFDALESGREGCWTYTGNDALDARLYRAGPDRSPLPSSLPLEIVEQRLLQLFGRHP